MYDIDKMSKEFKDDVIGILTLNCSNLNQTQIAAIATRINCLHLNNINTVQKGILTRLREINEGTKCY